MNKKRDLENEIFNLIMKYPITTQELADELSISYHNAYYYLDKLQTKKTIIKIGLYFYPSGFSIKINKINNRKIL